jgi:outer membrane protein
MRRLLICSAAYLLAAGPLHAAEPAARTLTLEEALKTAQARHPQMQAARAQTEASSARVMESRAALLPQVGASGTYTYGRSRGGTTVSSLGTGTSTATGTTTTTTYSSSSMGSSYRFGLSASELVYDFGQTSGRWNAANASLRSLQAQERNAAVQLAFNLRSAYYTSAAAKALLKVAEENVRNQDAHLRQIQGFVEAGTRPEIDLAQARTDRANAQVQLINAQVAYDTDKALLNQAMGVESSVDWDVVDAPSQAVSGEDGRPDDLMVEAVKARPDLLSLSHQVEAQELTTTSIKGGYAPSLGANASLTEQGDELGSLDWSAYVGLSLSWQLFGGGITEAQVRESRANTAVLRAQVEQQRQQVRTDVEQARLSVRATKAAIEAAHEAAANARIRLTLAEGRYQAGVGNVIELGDAQLALTTAAAQEVQATFNLATARAKLLQALGQL